MATHTQQKIAVFHQFAVARLSQTNSEIRLARPMIYRVVVLPTAEQDTFEEWASRPLKFRNRRPANSSSRRPGSHAQLKRCQCLGWHVMWYVGRA